MFKFSNLECDRKSFHMYDEFRSANRREYKRDESLYRRVLLSSEYENFHGPNYGVTLIEFPRSSRHRVDFRFGVWSQGAGAAGMLEMWIQNTTFSSIRVFQSLRDREPLWTANAPKSQFARSTKRQSPLTQSDGLLTCRRRAVV